MPHCLALTVSLLVLAGCAPTGGLAIADRTAPAVQHDALPDGPLPRIVLQRTACYGTCPAYAVQVTGDGVVTFRGDAHVRALGTQRDTVSADVVATLVEAFQAIDHAAFPDEIGWDTDLCEAIATDHPSAVTTIETASGGSVVSHYHGCHSSRLEPLYALEAAIDRVLGTPRWIGER